MRIPIYSGEVRAPANLQAAAPVLHARPPNDCAGQAQERQTAGANAVDPSASRSGKKACVKFYEPLYGLPSRQLISEDNDAARDAHEGNVGARHRSNPKVQLKQGGVQFRPLRLLQPSIPPTGLAVNAFWLRSGLAWALPWADDSWLRHKSDLSGKRSNAPQTSGQGTESDRQKRSSSVPDQQMRSLLEHALGLQGRQSKKDRQGSQCHP